MVAHTFNASAGKAEAAVLQVWSQSDLQREFQNNQVYTARKTKPNQQTNVAFSYESETHNQKYRTKVVPVSSIMPGRACAGFGFAHFGLCRCGRGINVMVGYVGQMSIPSSDKWF